MPDDRPLSVPSNPADPSQYIRTYAKDVAKLTGQPEPVATVPISAPAKTATIVTDGVETQAVEGGSANEDASETLATSEEDSQGIFAEKGASRPAPSPAPLQTDTDVDADSHDDIMQAPAAPAAPTFAPVAEVPFMAPTPAPAPAPENIEPARESILARLRENAAPAQPLPPSWAGGSVPGSAPGRAPGEPAVRNENPYIATPAALEAVAAPSNLHTFQSDFTDRMKEQHASAFSVIAAQSDAGAKRAARPVRNVLPYVAGIVLVCGGIGALFGGFYYYQKLTHVAPAANVPSLVAPDSASELTGSGASLMQALADLANSQIPHGTLVVAYLSTTTPTDKGVVKMAQPGGALIDALALPAPDILLRNIDPASTVGVISTDTGTAPFFIFRVMSYERTFAGMLQWESAMGADLAVLYPAYPAPAAAVPAAASTTHATSTPAKAKRAPVASTTPAVPAAPASLIAPRFTDETVSNHDVRALKDGKGRTLLLYGYVDKQTLILARDESAFTALLGRLTATPGT